MLVNSEYIYVLFFVLTLVCICWGIIFFVWCLMTKFYTRTHNAPYECGSDTFGDARRQIGLNFYNYGLSFIIFDIEIIFLLPAAPSFVFFSFTGRCFFMLFVILLIVGYRYELKHNFLNIKD